MPVRYSVAACDIICAIGCRNKCNCNQPLFALLGFLGIHCRARPIAADVNKVSSESGNQPIFSINALRTEGECSEQRGFANLLKGVFGCSNARKTTRPTCCPFTSRFLPNFYRLYV
jgi:hypothetical protein